MSLNRKQYYTSGRTFNAKGNKNMLNAIERNAFNPTRKLKGKKQSFVNSELEEMKCGGKVHKMKEGDEVLQEWAEKMKDKLPKRPDFVRPNNYEDYDYKTGWERGSLSDEERLYEKEWLENYYYPKHGHSGMKVPDMRYNPRVETLAKKEFVKQNPESVGYEMQDGGLTKMPHGGTHDKLKKTVRTVTFNAPAKDDSKSLDEVVVTATKPKRKHSNYTKQVLPEGYDEQDLYNDKMSFYNNWKRDFDKWKALKTKKDVDNHFSYNNLDDFDNEWEANQEALDRITLFDPDDSYSLLNPNKLFEEKNIDGNNLSIRLFEEPVNPKQTTSSAEESDYPTGWKPIMYQGKPLDPNVYGYMESTTTDVPLESITSNPVLWMNKRKRDMQTWDKSGEFPWGFKFNYGGDIPKMPGGGFLGDYTPAMGEPSKRKSFDYGFKPSYNTTLGTTGQLDFRKGWRGRGDQKATHNILGNIYGGRNQFGTTAGGSIGYGMQYNWDPRMNTIFRGDVGYDKQLGLNAGLEAGHRWNIVPSKQTKSGAKHSGSFDALVGFGVHSKPDERLAEYEPVFDNSGQIRDWSTTGLQRHVKFNYGIGANYDRELGPGKLGVFGKVMMDPAQGKILRTQGVPLEEDTALMKRTQSGKVEFNPQITAGLKYTMGYDSSKKKISKQIAKQKARDEAIDREQEMIARRKEELKRSSETGQSEFVREVGGAPLEQQLGGEVMELSDSEIAKLRKGGHIVIEQ